MHFETKYILHGVIVYYVLNDHDAPRWRVNYDNH